MAGHRLAHLPAFPQRLLALLDEEDSVLAPIVGVRPPLGQPALLERIERGHHRARVDARARPYLVLGDAGVAGEHVEHAELAWMETGLLIQGVRELRPRARADPIHEKARIAREGLRRALLPQHVDDNITSS